MPIDWSPRPRLSATMPACRAVVAAERHAPAQRRALLPAAAGAVLRGRLLGPGGRRSPAPRPRRASTRRASRMDRGPGRRARPAPRHARLPQPIAGVARPGLQARRPGRGAPLRARATSSSGSRRRPRTGRPPAASISPASGRSRPTRRPSPTWRPSCAALTLQDVESVLAWAGMPLATAEGAAVRSRGGRCPEGARPRRPRRSSRWGATGWCLA